mgnify:CR=1 FL=1
MKIFISLNESRDYTRNDFLKWKRKNVTIRGVQEIGKENNSGAMLGDGLYTAFLSNKQLAKQYGTVYFVVNAIPKNPKIFNTLNDWEIWFYRHLVTPHTKTADGDIPDVREFYKKTTIKDAMLKLGYDGVIIKGREMVNYLPDEDEIRYFENERQLEQYYEYVVNR